MRSYTNKQSFLSRHPQQNSGGGGGEMNDDDVARLPGGTQQFLGSRTPAAAKIYAPSCWRAPPRRTSVPSLAASKVASFVVSPTVPLFLYLTHLRGPSCPPATLHASLAPSPNPQTNYYCFPELTNHVKPLALMLFVSNL